MSTYDLLIFDLDGTLVPTEALATRVTRTLMTEHLAIDLDEEDFRRRYSGRNLEYQFADMATLFGGPLPSAFFEALEVAWVDAVENDLEPSVGVVDALQELSSIPRCVASNNTAAGIDVALRATELDSYFRRFFGVDDVEQAKPAPDLYLLAASEMDVAPDRCLVIEDTDVGVRGARAAGMDVVGYVGNDTQHPDVLRNEGADFVISHFSELAGIVHRAR